MSDPPVAKCVGSFFSTGVRWAVIMDERSDDFESSDRGENLV